MNTSVARRQRPFEPGDPVPWFVQRSTSNPAYHFDTVGGRYVVLCFFLQADNARGKGMLQIVTEHRDLFDDENIAFFGVGINPADEASGGVRASLPGVRHIWDFDRSVSRQFGAVVDDKGAGNMAVLRHWLVLDPNLRVRAVFHSARDGSERHEVAAYLRSLPPLDRYPGIAIQAPVLVIPRVFEPELCRQLIGIYEARGGNESGFMTDVAGKTAAKTDYGRKRRADCTIDDEALKKSIQRKFMARVNPELEKVHHYFASRMERYIVACYDSAVGAHFKAHRDNTTRGTAHRKFAVSINLNDDFDGGEVSFPEYGTRSYKAPPGCAVVFSCALLHEVSPVTRGRRFAFLPFLYDDAAARLRERNNVHLDAGVTPYSMAP